jgi:hypothetical protein
MGYTHYTFCPFPDASTITSGLCSSIFIKLYSQELCIFSFLFSQIKIFLGTPSSDDTLGALLAQDMQWFYPGIEHIAQGFDVISGRESGIFFTIVFFLKYIFSFCLITKVVNVYLRSSRLSSPLLLWKS